MRCKTQTAPILLIALFLVVSLGIVGFSVAGNEMDEAPEHILRKDTWSVEPKFIEREETVTIEGEVENVGEGSAEQYVDLYVNDMGNPEDYVTVNLEPGDSKTVTFEFDKTSEIDTYEVLVQQPDSGSQWEDKFEVKEKTVEDIDIYSQNHPQKDELTIEAGETLEFLVEAYNNDGQSMDYEDKDFTWYNTDDTGFFNKTKEGIYEVRAELEGVKSEPITVTVEPADAHRLVFREKPSEDKITAGEVAEYFVEVQDEYGNPQGEGEYKILLEVNEKNVSDATIEEGENNTAINWWTTREPGEYNIRAIEENGLLESDEVTLTVTEENDSTMAIQWWTFPLAISVIAVISLIYLWDNDKIYFSLGKKTNPTTHEWKKDKASDETSKETEKEELDMPDEDKKKGLD